MRYINKQVLDTLEKESKMALISGPRQVGKTTLVKHLLAQKGAGSGYFNWDVESHRKSILRKPEDFWKEKFSGKQKHCIALDEIHKYPRWKRFLKGLYDSVGRETEILVTGSGRLNVYQRGGDSLFGRYHLFHLHPLSVGELVRREKDNIALPEELMRSVSDVQVSSDAETALKKLFTLNGFPEPYYSSKEETLRRWRREHRHLIIEEDLVGLTLIREIGLVDALVELLPERVGSPLSLNALREDLNVAYNTVKGWIQALSSLYYLFEIRPFSGKLVRSLKREGKVYLFDGSVIESEGARFENLVALHLLKACDTWNDFGYGDYALHYVRDKEKREVDFLITERNHPWMMVECKFNQNVIDRSLEYFSERLNPKHIVQVVYGLDRSVCYKLQSGIIISSAARFLAQLP